jgi:hypothetical protein
VRIARDVKNTFVAIAAALFAVSSAAPVAAQSAPFCAAGQQPDFVLGFAKLHQRLGAGMGVALECEHTNPPSSDATQQTSTGLAYFRSGSGLVAFTNGFEHYALDGDELLEAQDSDIDAGEALLQARLDPGPSAGESADLSAAAVELERRDQLRSMAAFAYSEVLPVVVQ